MRVTEKVERTFWEDVAVNCTYATFYQTPYWAEVMAKTYPYIDVTKGFIFNDGTRVVFPFMRGRRASSLKRLLLPDDYFSGALYFYGGPIADRELSEDQLDEIIEYINSTFKKYNTILIRGNPFGQNITPTGFQEVKDLSHIVELFRYEDEEALLKSYTKRNRRYINNAKRSNMMIVKEGTNLAEYDKLYQIYRKSFKYWRNNILTDYPLLLFQNIYNLKNKYIKLWTVYYKDIMIGGEIMVYWNEYCVGCISNHDREYSKLHARRYMLHNVFLDCKEKGIRYYDFLQSSGMKGVEDFKRSMGGKEYPHIAWLKENSLLKKMRYIKKTLFS